LDKMGLTEEVLQELNPRLVRASITGFGEHGPLTDLAGLDQVIQGMSGLISVTGADRAHTYRVGVPIIDITSGMISAFSIVSALLGRHQGHPVQRVSTSLFETGLALSVFQGQKALSTGQAPTPQGNNHPVITPYGAYTTSTSPITIAVGNDRQWRDFCTVLGLPSLADDSRFATGRDRTEHRAELTELIEQRLAHHDADTWVERIRQAGIPCGPIYDYAQALATDQVEALHMIHHLQRADQTHLPLLRGPISVDGHPTEITSAPPLLGEHTSQVLHELGFAPEQVQALLDTGVVKAAPQPLEASARSEQ
jgi:CoA:oxalate CoA-transferase